MTTTTKATPISMAHAIGNQFRWTTPNTGGWQDRHHSAWFHPHKGAEVRIVRLIEALALYAEAHKYTDGGYETIANDGYGGPYYLTLLQATCKLLSMDTGRLDCGTLDALLREMAQVAGFDQEEV